MNAVDWEAPEPADAYNDPDDYVDEEVIEWGEWDEDAFDTARDDAL